MDSDRILGLKLFNQGLDSFGISLTDNQINQFMKYYELLIEWNKVMNLTAIIDFREVIIKHFLDSLSLVKVLRPNDEKLIDIGTGAGFPGIPLKIVFPNMNITLLDSLNKRINFLEEVIQALGLNNIKAIHGRAEDFGRDKNYREQYDLCVSRAVAKLPTLSEYCLPYVKAGGFFIPYKSGQSVEEIKEGEHALNILGATIEQVKEFYLPETDIERMLIVIHKKNKTPLKYPRNAGKPSKEPL